MRFCFNIDIWKLKWQTNNYCMNLSRRKIVNFREKHLAEMQEKTAKADEATLAGMLQKALHKAQGSDRLLDMGLSRNSYTFRNQAETVVQAVAEEVMKREAVIAANPDSPLASVLKKLKTLEKLDNGRMIAQTINPGVWPRKKPTLTSGPSI